MYSELFLWGSCSVCVKCIPCPDKRQLYNLLQIFHLPRNMKYPDTIHFTVECGSLANLQQTALLIEPLMGFYNLQITNQTGLDGCQSQ